ncbi:MAG: TadE family protein [Patescibacteria group bacterium]
MRKKLFIQSGWATLELVMLMPLIVGLIGIVFYFGQLAFLRLQLTSVTDAGARVAAIKDCNTGIQFVKDSIREMSIPLTIDCSSNEYITLNVRANLQSNVPFFDSIQKPISISASVLNEKQWTSKE